MPDEPKPIARPKLVIAKPKLIIGEGIEEMLFLNALIRHMGLSDIQTHHYEGKYKLSAYLDALRIDPGFRGIKSLGILRDADDNYESAFRSVCGALKDNGLPRPERPGICAHGNPKISVLILPDNQNNGMLEDVCLESVKQDPRMPCIDALFECVGKTSAQMPSNMAKARIHAWLALQREPDKRLGETAWPWDSNAFEPIRQFILAL